MNLKFWKLPARMRYLLNARRIFLICSEPAHRDVAREVRRHGGMRLVGFVNVLEGCRHSKVGHLVYASSSSVYGSNAKLPFSEDDSVDHPISLYAATKKA